MAITIKKFMFYAFVLLFSSSFLPNFGLLAKDNPMINVLNDLEKKCQNKAKLSPKIEKRKRSRSI